MLDYRSVVHLLPSYQYMDVSKNSGTTKWMVKIMENPYFLMDDLGGIFPPIFGNTQKKRFASRRLQGQSKVPPRRLFQPFTFLTLAGFFVPENIHRSRKCLVFWWWCPTNQPTNQLYAFSWRIRESSSNDGCLDFVVWMSCRFGVFRLPGYGCHVILEKHDHKVLLKLRNFVMAHE